MSSILYILCVVYIAIYISYSSVTDCFCEWHTPRNCGTVTNNYMHRLYRLRNQGYTQRYFTCATNVVQDGSPCTMSLS